MKKSINTGYKLNKCTEICHAGYFTLYDIANCKLLFSVCPRILIRELHGKCNLVALDVLDECTNSIANLEYLLGIIDPAP